MGKKIICIFAVFVLLSCTIGYCAEENITVKNNSFENGFDGYGVYEGLETQMVVDDTKAHSGQNAVRMDINGVDHTSLWQVIPLTVLCDWVKISAYVYFDTNVDAYNPNFSLRVEVYDTDGNQYEIAKTVMTTKQVVKGEWLYIETDFVKVPKKTLGIVLSYVNGMHGTTYLDDIVLTGQYSKSIPVAQKREQLILDLPNKGFEAKEIWQGDYTLSEGKRNGVYCGSVAGTVTQSIDLVTADLDKTVKLSLYAKGEVRLLIEGLDYHGNKTVIARSKILKSPDEFSYLETDVGIVLKRLEKLRIVIIGNALVDDVGELQ